MNRLNQRGEAVNYSRKKRQMNYIAKLLPLMIKKNYNVRIRLKISCCLMYENVSYSVNNKKYFVISDNFILFYSEHVELHSTLYAVEE